MTATSTALTFGDIVLILKRRFLIVAGCVAVGVAAAVAANAVLPESFQATASVSVNPIAVNESDSLPAEDQLLSMPTEQQVMSSAKVAELTLDRLPSAEAMSQAELLRSYVVTVPKDSRVLTITATAASPRQSADIANAVAQSYLSVRSSTATANVTQSIKDIKARLKSFEAAAKSGSDIAQRSAQVQIDALSNRLASLSNSSTQPGTVIASAAPPQGSTRPGLAIFGVGGAFLGLLVGASWVIVTAHRHERIENAQRLESLGGYAVIDASGERQRDNGWDRIALILTLPESLGKAESYFVGVDGPATRSGRSAGEELAEAGLRLGFETEFVDASRTELSQINQGWPTVKRPEWSGRIVVFDTSNVSSEAHRVILLGRADSVLLARRGKDDFGQLRRFVEMLHARNTSVDLIALTGPARLLSTAAGRKRDHHTVTSPV